MGDDEQKQQNNNDKLKQTILIKIISMDANELLVNGIKQGSNSVHTLEIALSDYICMQNANKSLSEYNAIYKDIDALHILLKEQMTNKLVITQPQKKKDNQKKKIQKE